MNVLVLLLIVCADPGAEAASQANKEEVDSRSVFVGNVSYMHIQLICSCKSTFGNRLFK